MYDRQLLLAGAKRHALLELWEVSARHVYGLNAAGENHGILLGTRRWTPDGAVADRGR